MLTSIDFLARDPLRAEQAVGAGWDVLVVDEARRLVGALNSNDLMRAKVI